MSYSPFYWTTRRVGQVPGLGNPASDKSVKDFLRLITAEQLQAWVTPKQATPFFIDKLTQLCSHLDKKVKKLGQGD